MADPDPVAHSYRESDTIDGDPAGYLSGLVRSAIRAHQPARLHGAYHAAVLLALNTEPPARIILTKRHRLLRSHPGEVAFPGGLAEPQDRDGTATAMREAGEEIGLRPDDIAICGELSDTLSHRGVVVTPVAGVLTRPPRLRPCVTEIECIFSVPVAFFLNQAPWRIDELRREHRSVFAPAFLWQGMEIWGLTAVILTHWLKLCFDFAFDFEQPRDGIPLRTWAQRHDRD